MCARQFRYRMTLGGTTWQGGLRQPLQGNKKRHLLIRGFGVRVPGGAPVLSRPYSRMAIRLMALWGTDGAVLGHAVARGEAHVSSLSRVVGVGFTCSYSRLAVCFRSIDCRCVGHGWVFEAGAGQAACGVEDHVGGSLGGVVGNLG
jgi:hypothetical protein